MTRPGLQMFARSASESRYPQLWRGLVGSWSLGPTGVTLRDWSGRANHGTLTDMDQGTDWVVSTHKGVSSWVLDFDGSNDLVNVPNADVLDFTSDYSVALWVYPRAINAFNNLLTRGTGDSDDIEIYVSAANGITIVHNRDNGGTLEFASNGSSFNVSGAGGWGTLSINLWTHLVITKGGGSWKVYRNGFQVGSTVTSVDDPLDSNHPWRFASSDHSAFGGVDKLDGLINDIRLYNRVLGADDALLLASRPNIAYEMRERRRAKPQRVIGGATMTGGMYVNQCGGLIA